MESWRLVWRDGFAPVLSDAALVALQHGLRHDDPRLIQGATTTPPPLLCMWEFDVLEADPVAYAGWHGERLTAVGEVEDYFMRTLAAAGRRLGDPGEVRWLLNWIDDTPRDRMRADLLAEVERALDARGVPVDGRGPVARPAAARQPTAPF